MTLSTIVPVAALSLFPHQEPRFLVPVVLPLVYLHGMTILPEVDHTLAEKPKNHIYGNKSSKQHSYIFLKFWLAINMLFIIFYGFVHQGGVFPATLYLYRDLKVTPTNVNYHIVTTYMYSIPESFLMQVPSDREVSRGNKIFKTRRRVYLHEEGSKDLKYISQKLNDILEKIHDGDPKKNKVYLLISSSLAEEFEYTAENTKLTIELEESFFPHLSVEGFPNLFKYCTSLSKSFHTQDCIVLPFGKYIWHIFNMFKLNLYKISKKDVNLIKNVIYKNDFK